jgi:hypothetical protein
MPLRLLVDSLNQWLLVGGLRKSLAGGAAFLPVNPQLRTSSGAQANFRLCANPDLSMRSRETDPLGPGP